MFKAVMTLGTFFVAAAMCLVAVTDVEAIGRRRRACPPCCCDPCSGAYGLGDAAYAAEAYSASPHAIPQWAQSVASDDCPAGYTCYCCFHGRLVKCSDLTGGDTCPAGMKFCLRDDSPVMIVCPIDQEKPPPNAPKTAAAPADRRLYRMKCACAPDGKCRLRFAYPGECEDGLFPLRFLGFECRPQH